MTEADIRKAIEACVSDFDPSALRVDEDFLEAGLDSLDHADILMALQDAHGLRVPDEDLEFCRSIQGILEYAARSAGG